MFLRNPEKLLELHELTPPKVKCFDTIHVLEYAKTPRIVQTVDHTSRYLFPDQFNKSVSRTEKLTRKVQVF